MTDHGATRDSGSLPSAARGAIGSVIMLPGVGTAIGAALGVLAGTANDGIIEAIDGLSDDVFTPHTIVLNVPAAQDLGNHPSVGTLQTLDIQEHDDKYVIEYD
jgi:hypothetical protein